MFRIILALFIIIPIIEIFLFMRIGALIGIAPTLGMIVLTAVIGVSMLKMQGLSTLQRAQNNLQENKLPATELVEGIILLLCGALLLTPGFFTDTVGFLMLVPNIRRAAAKTIIKKGKFQFMNGSGFSGFSTDQERQSPNDSQDGDVIDGEFHHENSDNNSQEQKKID